jgi:hypothetical protein
VNRLPRLLGCWYSTSQIAPKILQASLESIRRACDQSRFSQPHVATCVWQPISGNPFREHIAKHQLFNHLGIALQIQRIFAEEGASQFDAVCFLEHDVLYPHDYFDRVGVEFSRDRHVPIVSHLDYIGLNHTGWLDVTCRQDPLHQISLRAPFAVEHLRRIIDTCNREGACCLEPDDKSQFRRLPFVGEAPSVHINHGRNFTSHFNCFAPDSHGQTTHPYWGDFRQYYPDGEQDIPSRHKAATEKSYPPGESDATMNAAAPVPPVVAASPQTPPLAAPEQVVGRDIPRTNCPLCRAKIMLITQIPNFGHCPRCHANGPLIDNGTHTWCFQRPH